MNGRTLVQLANRSFGPLFGRWPLAALATGKSSAVVAGQFSIYAHKYLSTECLSASADLLCTHNWTKGQPLQPVDSGCGVAGVWCGRRHWQLISQPAATAKGGNATKRCWHELEAAQIWSGLVGAALARALRVWAFESRAAFWHLQRVCHLAISKLTCSTVRRRRLLTKKKKTKKKTMPADDNHPVGMRFVRSQALGHAHVQLPPGYLIIQAYLLFDWPLSAV